MLGVRELLGWTSARCNLERLQSADQTTSRWTSRYLLSGFCELSVDLQKQQKKEERKKI